MIGGMPSLEYARRPAAVWENRHGLDWRHAMDASRDADLALVEQMLAPPPLDDARRSLEYWKTRRRALPLYRRGARREAREMTARWEDRVRAAERLRFDSSLLGKALAALGISSAWVWQFRFRKRELARLGWNVVPRRLKLVAGAVAATGLIVTIAVVAGVILVLVQLS